MTNKFHTTTVPENVVTAQMECKHCHELIADDDTVVYTNWKARIVFHKDCFQTKVIA